MAISISIVKFSFFLYIIVSSIFATFYLLYLNHESSYAQHRIEPRSTVIREQQRQIPFHNQIEHYNGTHLEQLKMYTFSKKLMYIKS